MIAATGFTLLHRGTQEQRTRSMAALDRALSHFPDLKKLELAVGETFLVLWGRGELADCVHRMPDGSLLAVVGSPVGNASLAEVEGSLSGGGRLADFRLPWDGRVNLLHVSPDGSQWTIWNDWLGSIPIFYAALAQLRIASTLESAAVAAGGFGSEDIFLPGLLLLLSHGNFLGDWTLFREMHTLHPDSVTTFGPEGIQWRAFETIPATDERWQGGWDDLAEEMYALVKDAILQVLKTQPKWVVPLSSGLDSRLIAAVGAEAGIEMSAYTWGPSTTRDAAYSRQIARALNLPWLRIDLGEDYLARRLPLWADLFGSSMHFHGMYQVPFLEALRNIPHAPIASGYIGECLAGYDVHFQSDFYETSGRQYYALPLGYIHWRVEELKGLFRFPVDQALEEIADLIGSEKKPADDRWFQKLRFVTLWGRQNHFTYFQSMLSDYYRGVATPYLNRAYARFGLSLPRALLDERRLQIDMMRRHYPRVMSIGGTYAPDPALLTGSYLLKRRLAGALPAGLARRLLPEFAATRHIKTDITSMRAGGRAATWPIPDKSALLAEWLKMDQIDKAYRQALSGDIVGVRKLQSVQAFAYRLSGASGSADQAV